MDNEVKLVQDFILSFTSILYEALPFIVLGAIVAGFLEELVPQQAITKIIPQNRMLAIMLGGVLGLAFPMCECGIIVVMRRLLRKGLPLSTCVAYMLAGPIINAVVILSTWVAFEPHGLGPTIVGGRILMGFLVAVGTGWVVEFQHRKHGNALLLPQAMPQVTPLPVVGSTPAPRPSLLKRAGNISETALHDFVDITLFLILGALLAAFVQQMLTPDTVRDLSVGYPALVILSMMGLAILLCLCSEADAFVAASFTTLHPSAKLAFLVLGPMLDLKLMLMYTRVFRLRLIRTIIASVILQVFLYCVLFHYLFQLGVSAGWFLPPGVPASDG